MPFRPRNLGVTENFFRSKATSLEVKLYHKTNIADLAVP